MEGGGNGSQRIALVTGGSRGIGRAIAIALARNGAVVAVNYTRDESAATETIDRIEGRGGKAIAVQASVVDDDDLQRMVNVVHESVGPVDVLVHSAGIASRGHPVAGTDPEEPSRLLAVHALGPFRLTQLLLPDLRAAGRGDLVFISSAVAARNPANSSPYNMAKAAMESLALTLAKEEVGTVST